MALCDDCGHDEGHHRPDCRASASLVGWRYEKCRCLAFVPSPSTPGRDLVSVILALAVLLVVAYSIWRWGWM